MKNSQEMVEADGNKASLVPSLFLFLFFTDVRNYFYYFVLKEHCKNDDCRKKKT